jgi:hypothetical protein
MMAPCGTAFVFGDAGDKDELLEGLSEETVDKTTLGVSESVNMTVGCACRWFWKTLV